MFPAMESGNSRDMDYTMDDLDKSANLEFSSLVNNSSSLLTSATTNTVSGPPSPPPPPPPPHIQPRNGTITPPTRPSSTPFISTDYVSPCETIGSPELALPSCPQKISRLNISSSVAPPLAAPPSPRLGDQPKATFHDLPTEIHMMIVDILFNDQLSFKGPDLTLPSVLVKAKVPSRPVIGLSLSNLALVCRRWQDIVQPKLYHHIKLQGTHGGLASAASWLMEHEHMTKYIKDLEIWFPVFSHASLLERNYMMPQRLRRRPPSHYITANYKNLSIKSFVDSNCTILETFDFVSDFFPNLRTLRLEGGDRRKAPKVETGHHYGVAIPILKRIDTLVTRGQWNLIRNDVDIDFFMAALPDLRKWHMSYSKQKSKTYISMSQHVLSRISCSPISLLELNMESEYTREPMMPSFYTKAYQTAHICQPMARTVSEMEHFIYTGRICESFFRKLADLGHARSNSHPSRLKTMDITVKNICRDYHDVAGVSTGTGVHDLTFISLFEHLILSVIETLKVYPNMNFVRIRYLDLDSPIPPLNPTFTLSNNACTGLWSSSIVNAMNMSRPHVVFPYIDTYAATPVIINSDGTLAVNPNIRRGRIKAFHVDCYALVHQTLPQFA